MASFFLMLASSALRLMSSRVFAACSPQHTHQRSRCRFDALALPVVGRQHLERREGGDGEHGH
eukprot:1240707-Rhodomonas_salina.1